MSKSLFLLFPILLLFCCGSFSVRAEQGRWRAERDKRGNTLLLCDAENWKGLNPEGLHRVLRAGDAVRKEIDLSALPQEAIANARSIALRIHFGIVDMSLGNRQAPKYGFSEHFEITANGHVMKFATGDPRFPLTGDPAKPQRQEWINLPLPASCLKGDKLTVEIRKVSGDDDCLNVSVSREAPVVSSFVRSGGEWKRAPGELMVRLLLSEQSKEASAVLEVASGKKTDPENIIGFTRTLPSGFELELNRGNMDSSEALEILSSSDKPCAVFYAMPDGGAHQEAEMLGKTASGEFRHRIPAGSPPGRIEFNWKAADPVRRIQLNFAPALFEEIPVNPAPAIGEARGKRVPMRSRAEIRDGILRLRTSAYEADFQLRPHLRLKRLFCREIQSDIAGKENRSGFFRIRLADGQVFDGSRLPVKSVRALSDGAALRFALANTGIEAELTLRCDRDELRMGLLVENRSASAIAWTAAFPHLDTLRLDGGGEGDYYLFPWGGGLIADRNARLRSVYGDNSAWWQMVDLFSPARGGGVYLRCDDADGLYKGISLRKGRSCPVANILAQMPLPGRNDAAREYPDALSPDDGIGLAFDYQQYRRAPGKNVRYPDACLGTHTRSWKVAMERYAAWAEKRWPGHSTGRLNRFWNLKAGAGSKTPLYYGLVRERERWDAPESQIVEIYGYWKVHECGPWGVPMDRIADLGPSAERFYRNNDFFYRDPATGKMVYPGLGDYLTWNEQWGGIRAVESLANRMHNRGKLLIGYTDPMLLSGNSENGKKYGPRFCVINSAWKDPLQCRRNPKTPEHAVYNYFSYVMCLDSDEYLDAVAHEFAELCRRNRFDGIRLDEFGHGGYICNSRKHNHRFAEPGQNAWLQSVAHAVERIRAEIRKDNPKAVILSEFPGNDRTAAKLDGALSYDISRRRNALRPLPVNLFRFYFRNCKIFELNASGSVRQNVNFWLFNAVGSYHGHYTPEQIRMLNENTDAFNGAAEPLVPTLIPQVYANRFQSGRSEKTVWTLINLAGHTVSGPVLAVPDAPEFHYIDLLSGEEIPVAVSADTTRALTMSLKDGETRCIGKVRRYLRSLSGKTVVSGAPGNAVLQVGPNAGGRISGKLSADFTLLDSAGYLLDRAHLPLASSGQEKAN